MKSFIYRSMMLSALVLLVGTFAMAQTETFSDTNADYTFALPDAKWKMTVKPSATSPNVEYVFGDRIDGHLEVRKISIGKDELVGELIQNGEEQKLQFLPGYIAGKNENFAGKLKGIVFNYEYVRAGKSMAGRFYYLRSGDTTLYVVRFTGLKESLRTMRNQTDSIARTFGVK